MTRSNIAERALENGSTINLAGDEVAIFAYGSLLLVSSMEATLGRAYDRPLASCGLKGWRRSWDVFMPNTMFCESTSEGAFTPQNLIYLNVAPAPETTVNGLLYVIDKKELEAFDRREWIYSRLPVTTDLMGVDVRGGEAFVYVGLPDWLVNPHNTTRDWAAVRQTYLDMVEEGLEGLGSEFRSAYERSTDPLPPKLIFADSKMC